MKYLPLLLLLLLPSVAGAQVGVLMAKADPTIPAAPETFSTPYSLPTGGTTYTPADSAELQTALSSCALGDVIVLAAGTTYTGPFKLLDKGAGTDWIYIISSAMASLPAEGVRVAMSDATDMPTLTSAANAPLHSDFGAHHYRLAGIQILTGARDALTTAQFGYDGDFNTNATLESEQPHHITFDRCLIHSTDDAYRLRHGIMLNGEYMAVVDSYIANVKDGSDAQAVWVHNGAGPIKIVNNFLEATGENIMFGGSDPDIDNLVPSDIEIRGNYLFKRLDWKNNPSPNWGVKNLLELKNCQRVLVTGNVMENCWADSQAGMAVLVTVRNQSNNAPQSVTQDIDFRNNIVKNAASGFVVTGEDDVYQSQQTKRVRFDNNLFYNLTRDYTPDAQTIVSVASPDLPTLNLTISNNTLLTASDEIGPTNHLVFPNAGIKANGFVLTDNIFVHGTYPPYWPNVDNETITGNACIIMATNANYAENVSEFAVWHPGWTLANPDFTSAGFTDYANADFSLSAGSDLKGTGTGGADPGVDWSELQTATAGAISGTW